jgi:antitoxin CptB
MDLILGGFADRHINTLTKADLDDLDRLLGASDPDVYNWISGRETPPAEDRSRVLDLIIAAPPPAALAETVSESAGEKPQQ